tara:strand:+ start:86 stop:391 length:306 start_codon:yes stop_codon:yes gene_type:complete
MKTKEKVRYWLTKYPELRDDDNRLCANIWSEEIKQIKDIPDKISSFLIAYAANKLTAAPSIKRARAKLQEEEPEYRGKKYYLRKGTLQDKWRKDLGYEVNQ